MLVPSIVESRAGTEQHKVEWLPENVEAPIVCINDPVYTHNANQYRH